MEKTHVTRMKIQAHDGAQNQALGWMSGGDVIWHTGGTMGLAALGGFYEKQGRGIVVLCNSAAGRGVYPLVNLLLNSDWQMGKRPAVTTLDYRIYDSYAGQYPLTTNYFIGGRREGDRLPAEVTGQLPVELLPETATNFFVRINGKSVTFIVDGGGKVKNLISDVNGTEAEFARISDKPTERPAPPATPMFVTLNGTALDAFVGRYQLASGQVFNLGRKQDHLIMLPERRGGLGLHPESEAKASCPYFQCEVALLKDAKGETMGLTTSCPEP